MRIAYIVPSLGPLGPVIVVRNLVERMVAHGHECVVFYFDERADAMPFACETRKISFWHRENLSGFDWVHAHCFRPMVYAVLFYSQRKVVTMHSYLFTEYRYSLGRGLGYLLGRFTMFIANRFDRVVVLSNDGRDYYSRWIGQQKLRICCNSVDLQGQEGVDGEERDRILSFRSEGTLLCCVAEIAKIKNLEAVVQALAQLPEDFRLLLIGRGHDERRLRRLVERKGLADRVMFLGWRPQAHRYLALADVFCMPSWSEGFGLALFEAALHGMPIVCSDIGGMRERFSDEDVTYFDPHDAGALARAVGEACRHPEKGLRAKAVAETQFSTERMFDDYWQVYRGEERSSKERSSKERSSKERSRNDS